jgi:hypothetical protein
MTPIRPALPLAFLLATGAGAETPNVPVSVTPEVFWQSDHRDEYLGDPLVKPPVEGVNRWQLCAQASNIGYVIGVKRFVFLFKNATLTCDYGKDPVVAHQDPLR